MATSLEPLLRLSDARIHDEIRRATAVAIDAAYDQRRSRRLVLICINDCLVGLAIIAFSVHMSNSDLAPVVFYVGLIRALCVPLWTVLLTRWHEQNR